MPSTYTQNNGFEKPATGEQAGTWGSTVDTTFDLIDAAIDGLISITLSGTTYTLTITNGASSEGRNKVIVFTGNPTADCTVTVSPNTAEKVYIIRNATAYNLIMSQGSGATITVADGQTRLIYCDGAGATAAVYDAVVMSTTQVAEGTNQYFTQARARAALSAGGSLSYNSTTGVFSYTQPTNISAFTNDSGYVTQSGARSAISAGTNIVYNSGTGVISAPSNVSAFANDAGYVTSAGIRSQISASGSISYNSTTGVISYTQPVNVSAFTNDAGYVNVSGARGAISVSGSLSYNNGTGVISYSTPTNISTFTNDSGYVKKYTWNITNLGTTAVVENGYYVTGNGITLTLPTGSSNDRVGVISGLTTGQSFTIAAAGGKTVMGASTLVVDLAYASFELVLVGTDWRVF